MSRRWVAACAALIIVAAFSAATVLWSRDSGLRPVLASRHMIVTADQHASAAGRDILRTGGSAVDAAIAALLVLTLVEPQSSGIGGGLYLLVRDREGAMQGYDGRETAPASARPGMFLDAAGRVRPEEEIMIGGLPVGVPGAIAALWEAHRSNGKLPWPALFEPAIAIATRGFPISRQLAADISSLERDKLPRDIQKMYFSADGEPRRQGERITDPEYAATLRRIARDGPGGFYEGPVADAIVAAVNGAARNPARMTKDDLRSYRARAVAPLCGTYRQYRACSVPPSTSGGLTALQILGMLAHFPSDELQPGSISQAHVTTQASRLAYADRAHWQGDPAFIPVPVTGLLAPQYLAERAALIDRYWDMGSASAGTPHGAPEGRAPQRSPARRGTSHMAIVDAQGMAVSMTSSIQAGFGAQIRAAGFILNNELTDFSLEPEFSGRTVANAPAAGKRPLSAMGPFIVLRPDGSLFAVVGSPGGSDIIAYNVQTLSALIDGKKNIAEAVSLPHIVNTNGTTVLEPRPAALLVDARLCANSGHCPPLLE